MFSVDRFQCGVTEVCALPSALRYFSCLPTVNSSRHTWAANRLEQLVACPRGIGGCPQIRETKNTVCKYLKMCFVCTHYVRTYDWLTNRNVAPSQMNILGRPCEEQLSFHESPGPFERPGGLRRDMSIDRLRPSLSALYRYRHRLSVQLLEAMNASPTGQYATAHRNPFAASNYKLYRYWTSMTDDRRRRIDSLAYVLHFCQAPQSDAYSSLACSGTSYGMRH